ncbi:UNVERIFIED_CONTAM: hypothetical protein FKN15_040775 [Acipenser sinensis]
MSDDMDVIPEREMKDFQFKQMKKIRIFESPHELPKERCNLLAVSNKYGLTFAGGTKELKVFLTKQIIAANQPGGNPNEIEEGLKALSIPMKYPLHHIALSSDELTLSVCTMSRECGVVIIFYDVRTFLNKSSLSVAASDKDLQKRKASDPVMTGIFEEIAHFQKELDDLKARTTKADFSVGTPEQMKELRSEAEDLHTFILEIKETTEKKDEKREERFLNFSDLLFGSCTERQHHYYLSHIEDWDMVLAASAGSIEVSIIAKQEDKTNWELWLLEDASRAELPVTLSNEDTLPVGVAIDYTSQGEIHISDEKSLPPAPILMLLSTDGVLCPFYLINQNPGAKQLITPPGPLSIEGERQPKAGAVSSPPPATSAPSASAVIPAAAPALRPPATTFSSSATAAAQVMAPAASTAAFSFTSNPPSGSAFSLGPATSKPAVGTTSFRGTSSFSFAPPNAKSMPVATSASNFSFGSASVKPLGESSAAPPGMTTPIASFKTNLDPSTPPVKLNLADRFSAVETPAPSAVGSVGQFAFTSTPKPAFAGPVGQSMPLPVSVPVSAAKSNKIAALSVSVWGSNGACGSVFQQQASSGGGLFGSGSGNGAGAGGGGGGGGGFFSGLGGKPSEDAANKNPFGVASGGGFGQTSQPGANSLFGNSGAKGFGSSSFGEKPSGTFSTGASSVATQGFGSFTSPVKAGGFGAAPVFGSPPAFGSSPSFGGSPAFGSAPTFSSPLGSTGSKVFGEGTAAASAGGFGSFASASNAPTFGSLASQNAPSFGNLAQQGPGFGGQQSAGFTGFGSTGGDLLNLWAVGEVRFYRICCQPHNCAPAAAICNQALKSYCLLTTISVLSHSCKGACALIMQHAVK